MGDPLAVQDLVSLPTLQPERQPDGSWAAQVLHIDRFGNLITNVQYPADDRGSPAPSLRISAGGRQISGLSRTFSDVAPGDLVAYVGSSGYLEIAVRGGNAAAHLSMDVGDPVWIEGGP
jgi:S-adenosylmethionine hydrolase